MILGNHFILQMRGVKGCFPRVIGMPRIPPRGCFFDNNLSICSYINTFSDSWRLGVYLCHRKFPVFSYTKFLKPLSPLPPCKTI